MIGQSPKIKNFEIRNSNPDRVYFESNKSISGQSIQGFVIGDKKIISIFINSDKKSDHYFTVHSPFNYWDNNLIRYDGGSDIVDINNLKISRFNLQYIVNKVAEPDNSLNFYVSLQGDDQNDGSSEESSWRTLSKACNSVNEGSTIWVKSGKYLDENIIIQKSGSPSKPIKIIGYKTLSVNGKNLKRSIDMDFNSSELPLLTGEIGTAISTSENSYIIVKNLQIQNYSEYGILLRGSNFIHIENCYLKNGKFGVWTQNGNSRNNRVIDCYFSNFSKNALKLSNKNNLIANTWSVSSQVIGQDYYINIRGGKNGTNNIVRNCYVERFVNDSHGGHGISLKSAKTTYQCRYNLVENCEIINVGGALEFRHSGTQFNVARNIKLGQTEPNNSGGVTFRDGSSHNILENSYLSGEKGVEFRQNSKEDYGYQIGGSHNKIINTVFHDLKYAIFINDVLDENESNEFLNCTFTNVNFLLSQLSSNKASDKFDDSNLIVNCIMNDVKSKIKYGSPTFVIEYSNFYNSFDAPKSHGNLFIDIFLDNDFRLKLATPKAVLRGGKSIDLLYDKDYNDRTIPFSIGTYEID